MKQMVGALTPSQRLGYLFIFMVASIWVLASFLVQVRLCARDTTCHAAVSARVVRSTAAE